MRLRVTLVAVAFASLTLASSASAGTAAIFGGDTVRFTAAAAETNTVTVSKAGNVFTVTDTTTPLTVGFGCSAVTANSATCADTDVERLDIELGDLNDTATIDASVPDLQTSVSGDAGNDTLNAGANIDFGTYVGGTEDDILNGGASGDRLIGGDGNDQLRGNGEGDSLEGNAGADLMDGGDGNDGLDGASSPDGADVMIGGAGPFDSLSYGSRSAAEAVSVTTNGVADDGTACPGALCEGDNVGGDIERLQGTAGNDSITLGDADQQLNGSAGDDTLDAGGGNDSVFGDDGDDVVHGGAGDDRVSGGTGKDTADGGPGDDRLDGDAYGDVEPDVLVGGKGLDLADFSFTADPLRISLDNKANDGREGEGDNVRDDVEDVVGGEEDDIITGSKAANDLEGGIGSDTLSGLAGSDSLIGAAGSDKLFGGKGQDLLDGGAGSDRLSSRDKRTDEVRCGSAFDIAKIDRVDRRGPDCDKVQLPKRKRGHK